MVVPYAGAIAPLVLIKPRVSESGEISGLWIFKMTGIGKSKSIRIASPAPRMGKNSKEVLLAVEMAFAIASLSW